MIVTDLSITAAKWTAKALPKLMLNLFYGPKKMEGLVSVDFPGNVPGVVFRRSPPQMEVNLKVWNNSPVPITIDRILINVCNGCGLEFGNHHRFDLKRYSIYNSINCRHPIQDSQWKLVEFLFDEKGRMRNSVKVEVTYYCEYKGGSFHNRAYLDLPGEIVPPI